MLTCVPISIISWLSYVSLAKLVSHTAPLLVLTLWHGLSQRQEVLQRKEEAAKQAAWGQAGVIIEDLKAALADAQQQLRKERAARDQLEEDMKQSFMRSVCAINLEVRFLPTTESCIELSDAELRAKLACSGHMMQRGGVSASGSLIQHGSIHSTQVPAKL